VQRRPGGSTCPRTPDVLDQLIRSQHLARTDEQGGKKASQPPPAQPHLAVVHEHLHLPEDSELGRLLGHRELLSSRSRDGECGWRDSNPQQPVSETGASARLRHIRRRRAHEVPAVLSVDQGAIRGSAGGWCWKPQPRLYAWTRKAVDCDLVRRRGQVRSLECVFQSGLDVLDLGDCFVERPLARSNRHHARTLWPRHRKQDFESGPPRLELGVLPLHQGLRERTTRLERASSEWRSGALPAELRPRGNARLDSKQRPLPSQDSAHSAELRACVMSTEPPAGVEPAPRPYKGRVLAVDTTEA
jgi:hypothetical protein